MKVSELDCYKLSTSFSLPGSELCSINNDFAVILKTGVHILKFRPNIQFTGDKYWTERTFIKTPTELPFGDVPIDYKKLDRRKFCILSMNSKLTPAENLYDQPLIYVKQINWGSIRSLSGYRAVLGILTNHGCLQLYMLDRFTWIKATDLSMVWKQHCLKISLNENDDDFDSYIKKFQLIRIIAFTWCSGLHLNDEDESLILTVSESGVFSFWKINGNMSEVQAEIITTVELSVQVHSILWHAISNCNGWVVISCTDGTVYLYTCERNAGSGELSLQLSHSLWSKNDYILAQNVKLRSKVDKCFLIFSKEHCVMVFQLKPEIRVHVHEFHRRVAGVEFINDSDIFVTLMNFESFTIQYENSSSEHVLVPCNTKTNVRNHRCSGLAFTRNKSFCVFSMSIAKYHDHLALKEPWYLLLCWMNDEVTLPDLQNFVTQNSVHEAYDYIESFRIHSINNKKLIDEVALTTVWSYLNGDQEICRRILQLMCVLMSGCCLTKSKEHTLTIEILLNICNFRWSSAKSEKYDRKINLFYSWLRANLSKLPEFLNKYKLLQDVTADLKSYNFTRVEKCELCSIDIKSHESWKYVICENGHKMLRCSHSFLPVALQPCMECTICHSVMIQIDGLHHCVICDSQF